MKKTTIILFLLVFSSSLIFAQNNHSQNLEDLAVIRFPATPIIVDTMGQKVYSLAMDKVNYIVIIMNTIANKFELKEGDLEEFYTGTIKGSLKASEGKLITKKEFTVDGLKGIEFEYTTTKDADLPNLRFQRMIYTDKGVFSINFWTNDENKNRLQEKDDFFNSLKFNTKDKELKQFTTPAMSSDRRQNNPAYNVGYSIGKVLGYLLIPGIIILVIVLVRKKNNKSEKDIKDIGKN